MAASETKKGLSKKELREWMAYYHEAWIADHNKLVQLGIVHKHPPALQQSFLTRRATLKEVGEWLAAHPFNSPDAKHFVEFGLGLLRGEMPEEEA